MNKNYLLIVISAIIIIGGLLLWQRGRFASETELNEVSQELEAVSSQDWEDSGLEELSPNASTSTSSDSEITKELAMMTGQKCETIKSKKSISGFKLRVGQVIGLKTTLRRGRAVDFLQRLINMVLPRVKDFRGLKLTAIDKSGVLNIGIKDKSIFPEIVPEESKVSFGLEISVVPKTRKREEALEVYSLLKFPIIKKKNG